MNPGGIVIVIAGVWLGCQIFGGSALERLGVVTPSSSKGTSGSSKPAAATSPAGSTTVLPA